MKSACASCTLLCAALALAACHSTPAPVIDSFTADANPAPAGAPLTLHWSVQNADTLSIDQSVGDVTGKTSTTVTPQATTTYTLTASSGGGSATRTLTIAVNAPGIVWFTATPSQVQAGAAVTLAWNVKGGAAVSIDGTAAAGNSLVVHPTVTTSYTLTLGPAGATATAKALVRVVSAPEIIGFTASPAAIAQGSPAVLSWGGTGLGYSLDNGVGDVGAQTRATVRPALTTTYTLTARGPAGGTATALQTVTVTPATGARGLSYVAPATIPGGAVLKLVADPASTSTLLVLKLVTTQPTAAASALAFGLALDATKVALDAAQSGDVSPGFVVNFNKDALDPGSAPAAARASLRTDGPLAGVLTLGISLKPLGGVTPADKTLPAGTELCRFRLVIAAGAGPGPVFPLSADPAHPDPSDPYKPYKALLRSGQAQSATLPASTVALGTLTLL